MNKLELFKPIMYLKDIKNPIIFDELGLKYKEKYKDMRPIIIFYDEINKDYWYIKSRSTKNKNGKHRPEYKGEIIVGKSNEGLFKNESYVDCSQIFKINADLLESLIDKNHNLYNETSVLNKNEQEIILNKINYYLNQQPPYLSIVEVDKKGHKIEGNSLYLCPEKWEKIEEECTMKEEDEKLRNKKINILMESKLDEYSDKYSKTMDFKKAFQEKYFPIESLELKN